MRFILVVAALIPCVASAQELTTPQKREILSALLCIDLDAQAQAKQAIASERLTAKQSGGGVVDLALIKGYQDDFAIAKREEAHARSQLAALRAKPAKCSDVARMYNCVNNRCDQVDCTSDLCDIGGIKRIFEFMKGARLSGAIVTSNESYTFTAPSR